MLKNKNYIKTSAILLLLVLQSTATLGCSTRSSVVREETVTTSNEHPHDDHFDDTHHETEVVTKTTTENVETKDEACSGILSCVVHATGKVIVFPFVVLGEIFDVIF